MSLLRQKYLVIDYGTSCIRGILYERSVFGSKILRCEILPVVFFQKSKGEKASSNDSSISQKKENFSEETVWEQYEYNIQRFVESFFPDEENFALLLPSHRLHIRSLSIVEADPKELPRIIPFEAEESLPFSLDHTEVIGQEWGSFEDHIHVLCFASQHEFIKKRIHPLLHDRSSIHLLVPDSAALFSFARALDPEFSKNHYLQVNIGASHTILNVIENGNLSFSRSISYGGNDLNEIIAPIFNSSDPDEIEKKKLSLKLYLHTKDEKVDPSYYQQKSISKKNLVSLLEKVKIWATHLCREMDRSLLGSKVSDSWNLYLSGGGSLIHGLDQWIEHQLKQPVKRYPAFFNSDIPIEQFACVLGGKEHCLLPDRKKFDFLDTPFGATLKKRVFQLKLFAPPLYIAAASLCILLTSFIMGIIKDQSQIRQFEKNIRKISEGIPGLSPNLSSDRILLETKKICRKHLQNSRRNDTRSLVLLKELSQVIPPIEEMFLTFRSFSYNEGDIEVEVELRSVGDSNTFLGKFNKNELFSKVEVKRRTILPNQHVRVVYTFNTTQKSEVLSSCK